MPIYEFTCNACRTGRRFSVLVGMVADAPPPRCPRCNGVDLSKCVSRFARVRSEDQALDDLADVADRLDENDPQAMRRLMKEMASSMDDDMDADELEAMMEEEASGGGDPEGPEGGE